MRWEKRGDCSAERKKVIFAEDNKRFTRAGGMGSNGDDE